MGLIPTEKNDLNDSNRYCTFDGRLLDSLISRILERRVELIEEIRCGTKAKVPRYGVRRIRGTCRRGIGYWVLILVLELVLLLVLLLVSVSYIISYQYRSYGQFRTVSLSSLCLSCVLVCA